MQVKGSSKIVSRDEALVLTHQWQKEGKTVGFTSGIFDLIHSGHVRYLKEAARYCDILIVAVNSDASTRSFKGPKRPIRSEQDRVKVVSAFDSVDLVFIFADSNNNKNVELLKPNIYVKAGDYKKEGLSSAAIVEKFGGKVLILPHFEGLSSTGLVDTILELYADELPHSEDADKYAPAPAVFVDRDGTINEELEYICDKSDFKIIPGSMEALKRLKDAGYRVVVVTNQPGIGLGYYTRGDFFSINKELLRGAAKVGALIDRVYYCPHSLAVNCTCRKPGTALLERAVRELNIISEKSIVIGDSTCDIQLGKNFGIKTILVRTGSAGTDGVFKVDPDSIVDNLSDAAKLILGS